MDYVVTDSKEMEQTRVALRRTIKAILVGEVAAGSDLMTVVTRLDAATAEIAAQAQTPNEQLYIKTETVGILADVVKRKLEHPGKWSEEGVALLQSLQSYVGSTASLLASVKENLAPWLLTSAQMEGLQAKSATVLEILRLDAEAITSAKSTLAQAGRNVASQISGNAARFSQALGR